VTDDDKKRIAELTITGLNDLADRLEIVGGRIEATGLRTTIVSRCPCRVLGAVSMPNCPACMGTGYVRKVIEHGSN